MKIIPYEDLKRVNAPFEQAFSSAIDRVLQSGWYILGTEVLNFEESFSKYIGANYCIGLASGLDALFLALKALDFPPGSEVIVPSNTYIATILSIIQAGLRPVLVEPDIQTYNIDPTKIEAAITPGTKAIMIVHLYGKAETRSGRKMGHVTMLGKDITDLNHQVNVVKQHIKVISKSNES
jgi:dTDP-4-amino-4,6-dideoxygalactose transaminase